MEPGPVYLEQYETKRTEFKAILHITNHQPQDGRFLTQLVNKFCLLSINKYCKTANCQKNGHRLYCSAQPVMQPGPESQRRLGMYLANPGLTDTQHLANFLEVHFFIVIKHQHQLFTLGQLINSFY